jgi:acyl carrier protein
VRSDALPTERMVTVWRQVLGTEVRDTDSFLGLGGDSAQAMRLLVACQREFGVAPSFALLTALFDARDLTAFTAVLCGLPLTVDEH